MANNTPVSGIGQPDATGAQKVDVVAGGGSGSNAAAGLTGSNVPTSADYQGVSVAGTLRGVTGLVLTNATPMEVAIVDGSGNQITSFGGGTQYADAAASGAHPTGTQLIGWNKGGSTELAVTAAGLTNAQALHVAIVDGSGNQITSFGGGTQYADGTTQATPTGTVAMGKNASNVLHALSLDSSGNLFVDVATAALVTDRTVTGTITSTQTVVISGQGGSAINFQVTGSWTGTLTFEQTVDGVTWNLANCKQIPSGPIVQGTTTNGQFTHPSGGVNQFRVRGNTVSSGTATVALEVGQGSYFIQVGNLVAADLLVTASQGGAPWTVKPDGTVWALTGTSANVNVMNTTLAVTQSTSPWVDNITQWNSVALGSPSAYGTGPGAVNVIGVNAFVTNSVTVTGTVTANQGGAPWSQNLTQVAGTALGATAVVNYGSTPAAAAVPGVNAFVTNTVTVSGTVTANQGGSPWGVNVTQVASTALGTPQTFGTAPTGVVIGTSSDIYVAGTRARSNQTTTAAGVLDVNIVGSLGATNSVTNGTFIAITDNTTKVGVIAGTTALKTDMSSVAGTATVTVAAGVQRVGIAGNANATLDATMAAGTAPTNALGQLAQYFTVTNYPAATNSQTVSLQCDTTGALAVNIGGRKKTYSAMTPVASAGGGTGVIAQIPGNASTTVRITRVEVTLSTTGTAGIEQVQLIKTSTAPTGGTSVNMVIVPHDSNFAGASSQPLAYTTVPTAGTAVGPIRGVQFFDESGTVTGSATWIWEFGNRAGASEVVLRGTAQTLEINLGGTIATQTALVSIEWEEDNS